ERDARGAVSACRERLRGGVHRRARAPAQGGAVIRARATAQDGRPVIFLGVNREKIRRLVDLNQPIRLTGESVGTPDIDSVIVVFGEDNEQVFERLKHFADVTPDTIVHVEAKKERSPLIVPESLTPNTVLH